MKELSIEQKARRFDEALAMAKECITYVPDNAVNRYMLDMFPELEEDRDEKIRKALINFFDGWGDKRWDSGIKYSEVVGWIQKQGEQKHTDKVEPRFKVGDWITDNTSTFQIVRIEIERAENGVEYEWYYVDDGDRICFDVAHQYYHLWTIQDAKDGDVLATPDYILIFKEFLKNDGGISYCHYDFGSGNPQFIWFEDKNWHFCKEAIIHPATKEQRDLLFQKMKEAGYEWDSEKKELKKIEQNPAWSEEDEEKFSFIHAILIDAKSHNNCASNSTYYREVTESIDWLKSLKGKVGCEVNCTTKQEWSEEDEKIYKSITYSFAHNYPLTVQQQEFVKSIRAQNTWKPSDEQMERLKGTINSLPHQEVLYSLYQDLLKLKG